MLCIFICRYLKNELVHKGALGTWALPKEYLDAAVPDSPRNIFSKEQHDRFHTQLLLTGAWFLECSQNIVHKEEAHLLPPPNLGTDGHAAMEVEDDDDDAFKDEVVAPVVLPKGRGVRKRRGNDVERDAPVEDGVAGRREVDSTQASQRTEEGVVALTQGLQGTTASLSQLSQGIIPASGRREGSSSQASQGGLTQAGSQPSSSNAVNDSVQSPHRPSQAKHAKRPVPVPKHAANTSSSPEIPTLPMYLEKGNMVELICESNRTKRLGKQLHDIVEHIKKVSCSYESYCPTLCTFYHSISF